MSSFLLGKRPGVPFSLSPPKIFLVRFFISKKMNSKNLQHELEARARGERKRFSKTSYFLLSWNRTNVKGFLKLLISFCLDAKERKNQGCSLKNGKQFPFSKQKELACAQTTFCFSRKWKPFSFSFFMKRPNEQISSLLYSSLNINHYLPINH